MSNFNYSPCLGFNVELDAKGGYQQIVISQDADDEGDFVFLTRQEAEKLLEVLPGFIAEMKPTT